MSQLEVAVVGAGNIAQKHLAVLCNLPETEVCCLVDRNDEALEETADTFGIPGRLATYEPLLGQARPDAVFVLVSVTSMAEVAGAFLAAGIPTFLEKPPGLHTWETRKLAQLAQERDVCAMAGVNRRFYSNILLGREKLLEAGPVLSVTVEAHEDIDRIRKGMKFPPEVMQRWSVANGIHALDLLRFFGRDVGKVTAVRRTCQGPMPDTCAAIIEFENGALGRAAMDWTAPGGHRFEVRAAGATLTSNPGFSRLTFLRRGHQPETLEFDEDDRTYKPGFYKQDRTFLECVRDSRPLPFPACSLGDAVKTIEMIDAIAGTS